MCEKWMVWRKCNLICNSTQKLQKLRLKPRKTIKWNGLKMKRAKDWTKYEK